MLSREAAKHAELIEAYPWAGINDPPYSETEARGIRINVMWVTAQVLAYYDPGNFDVVEFAEACGVTGLSRKFLEAGLRGKRGDYDEPGVLRARR